MSKFEIEFPPALADFLDRQIEAGLYNTVSDVVQDAVRRLSESDDAKLAALRAALAPGLADIEAGRFFDGSIEDILGEARAGAVARK